MAFVLTCDVDACRAEIERCATGQPTLSGKRHSYCPRCAGYIAAVDQEMAKLVTTRSLALANDLDALRQKMITEALPAQKGGTGGTGEYSVTAP